MKKFSQSLIALLAIFSFAANASEPQIHIKTRFLKMSEKDFQDFVQPILSANSSAQSGTNGLVELLTDERFKLILRALEAKPGIETLAEPEVTTVSGRQTKMCATTKMETDIVNDVIVENNPEIGPALDVAPYVLSDGHTINLTLIPLLPELLASSNSAPNISSNFRARQVVNTLNLWDGQTAMIRRLPEKNYVNGKDILDKTKSDDKELLIFITATLVDTAYNRIHSDQELPFAQTGFPPQPK